MSQNTTAMQRGALAAGQATAAQQGVAYAALPDEGEPWRGHKFKEVQRGCWRCDCGKTIKEVTSDQSTPASGGNYPVMPKRYTVDDDGEELFTAEKMRAFADATYMLRAAHGQAPAQPATVHCKGRNCAAVDGDGHSDECASDHELAASGLDTAGNRNPVARYDGYRGAPCNPAYTKDQQAAWLEGYEARNRQGITPSPQAAQQAVEGGDAEDAARYRLLRRGQHWSVIDGIGNDLRAEALDAAVDAARKQGASHDR